MTTFRSKPMSHKGSVLPLGVSETWRSRPNRNPYFEFQVYYVEDGAEKIKHFYVGVSPTRNKLRTQRKAAIKFRQDYEQKLKEQAC